MDNIKIIQSITDLGVLVDYVKYPNDQDLDPEFLLKRLELVKLRLESYWEKTEEGIDWKTQRGAQETPEYHQHTDEEGRATYSTNVSED